MSDTQDHYRADVLRHYGPAAALHAIIGDVRAEWASVEEHITATHHETSAAQAAASTTEEHMSLLTEAESLYAGAKNELARFEAALPGALEKAKQFEASPFALLAEKVAGTVLPPEAVAIAVNAADKVLEDLLALYAPQTPAQPPA